MQLGGLSRRKRGFDRSRGLLRGILGGMRISCEGVHDDDEVMKCDLFDAFGLRDTLVSWRLRALIPVRLDL